MARAPRLNFPDAVYHVSSRGNGRARTDKGGYQIVCEDDERQRFPRQLQDDVATHAVRPYAWGLMDNHFHLLARAAGEPVAVHAVADLDPLLSRIRTAHVENAANEPKV